jgi:hypothetical protein
VEAVAVRRRFAAAVATLTIAAGAVALAKGETTKVTIAGRDLRATVTITDPDVLKPFNVWSGPGTGGTVNGVAWKSNDGFIVDWPAGDAAQRPDNLPRYEVSFYTNLPNRFDAGPTYIVFYEYDRATGQGYVYLPGRNDPQYRRNVFAILRGVEGRWFYAARAWQDAVADLLLAARRE